MRHLNCGGNVFVDVTSAFKLLAGVATLSKERRLITTRLSFEQHSKVLSEYNYICSRCNNLVDSDYIMESCRSCSKKYEAKEIFIPKDSNGCFCKKCYDEMFSEEEAVTLAEILSVHKLHIV